MKLLFDLFPVVLFFATFKFAQSDPQATADMVQTVCGGSLDVAQAPILAATFVAIVASLIQVGWVFARGKKPEIMLWISLAVIIVFGGLTIFLHNAWFIKWKPTILYWLFGSILAYGTLTKRNFMMKLMAGKMELPRKAWDCMQKAWIGFFYVVGAVNLFVAYSFSTETWVNFKLFGLLGITLVFTLGFGVWLSTQLPKDTGIQKQ